MAYYLQGDYYVGDYYRGDPFLGGVLKRVGGAIKGAVGGLFSGGPVGAILGGIAGATTGPSAQAAAVPAQLSIPPGPMPTQIRETAIGPGGVIYKSTETTQRAGVQFSGFGGGGTDGCPKGYHLNKSNYYRQGQFVAKGTVCVRNRRMNVGNAKALRKSIRRSKGFIKTFRKAASAVGHSVVSKRAPKMRKR